MDGNPNPTRIDADAVPFVIRLARALHASGAPAPRIEDAVGLVSEQLGLRGQFFSTPTSIFAAFGPMGKQRMVLERVEPAEVDLGKLAALDDLLDDFGRREVQVPAAESRLSEIESSSGRQPLAAWVAAYALVSLSGAYVFGGGLYDIGVAGGVGVLLGLLTRLLDRVHATRRLLELVASASAAFLAGFAGAEIAGVYPFVVSISALLVLLPGLNLTTATSELASRHFVSGSSRFAGTAVVLVTLGFGTALGSRLSEAVFGSVVSDPPAQLALIFAIPALLLAAVGLTMLFRARWRDFIWILSAASVAFALSRLGTTFLGPELGALLAAFALGILGSLVSRVFRRPSAVVQVPGLVILVPGSVGFRSVAALVEQDTVSGVQTAFAMLVVAVAIVTGLLVAQAVLPSRRAL